MDVSVQASQPAHVPPSPAGRRRASNTVEPTTDDGQQPVGRGRSGRVKAEGSTRQAAAAARGKMNAPDPTLEKSKPAGGKAKDGAVSEDDTWKKTKARRNPTGEEMVLRLVYND